MKKKSIKKLTLQKNVISDLKKQKGGIWLSLPHTACFCWAPSADPAWSNVGCSPY